MPLLYFFFFEIHLQLHLSEIKSISIGLFEIFNIKLLRGELQLAQTLIINILN